MVSSGVISPVMENRKLTANSVTIENSAKTIMTEQKSRICVIKCRSGVNSDIGNGMFDATKGKLPATQITMKFVVTTDSHKFRKFVARNFKPALCFHSFTMLHPRFLCDLCSM